MSTGPSAPVQTSPDPIIVLASDWSIVEHSPSAEPLLRLMGLVPSDTSSATQTVWAEVIARAFKGEDVDFAFVTGGLDWEFRLRPWGKGKEQRVVIHGRNVTASKLAERGRDEALGRFDALLDALTDAAVVVDRELTVIAANAACVNRLGHIEPPLGSDATRWIPELQDRFAAIYRRALDGRTVRESVEWQRGDKVTTLHVTASPIRHRAVIVGAVAITRGTDALPRDRARLHLVEAIPDLVAIVRRDGTLAELKPAIGPHPPTFEEIDSADLRARLHEALRTKGLHTYDYEAVVDGAPQTREVRLQALDGDEAVLIVRDVTEQRRLMSTLLVADRMASLGTLSAGVAHELNNPLAYTSSNLAFVEEELRRDLRDHGPTQATSELLAAIVESREGLERMAVIVKDLKAFSRPPEETVADIDVNRLLDRVLKIVMPELRHKGELEKSYAEVGAVRGNEARLSQVFLNLIVNAVQAFDERLAKRNLLRVRTGTRGNQVVIEVADNGPGIPAGIRGRVFDPFFTTKPQGVGTGLGLAICLGLTRGMGGDIELESVEGEGTIFRVVLPSVIASERQRDPTSFGRIPTAKARLLLVDDDPLVLSSMRKLLREHEVETVLSGREALAKLEAGERYDLVVCDVMMPEMTGVEFLEAVRERWPDQERCVVLMTGGAVTAETRAFLESAPAVLEKPFTRDAVRDCLNRVRGGMLR